jgi:SAM-dependent methyltransferase
VNRRDLRNAIAQRLFAGGHDETGERASLESLGLEHPDRQPYIPSAWWILRWLLPKSDVGPADTFVEFGCGKGRVVLDAARRYPFKTVVGVDLSAELTEVASTLVERERPKLRCPDVRIETMDATRFPIPDDMTFAYLFNPFNGAIFEQVRDNMLASLDRAPRKLRVIYVMPLEHQALMESGRFEAVRHVRTTRLVAPVEAAIYEAR